MSSQRRLLHVTVRRFILKADDEKLFRNEIRRRREKKNRKRRTFPTFADGDEQGLFLDVNHFESAFWRVTSEVTHGRGDWGNEGRE